MTEGADDAIVPRPNEAATVARSGLVQRGLALANSAPARVAQYAVTTEGARLAGVHFDWVTIPAGEFLMGSTEEQIEKAFVHALFAIAAGKTAAKRTVELEDWFSFEAPPHRVCLPAFRIARVPVTNAQYEKCVDATGHATPEHWAHGRIPPGKENHPVVNVSWYDAQAFCEWATSVLDREIRLPTEAEWEKAARGTDGRIFPWGDDAPTKDHCNFNGKVGDTTPVGRYPQGASPYGVLDMAGNVWEWTRSLYEPYPYDAADGREDMETDGFRTLRGGSWDFNDLSVRCADWFNFLPGYWSTYFGFRVVTP